MEHRFNGITVGIGVFASIAEKYRFGYLDIIYILNIIYVWVNT